MYFIIIEKDIFCIFYWLPWAQRISIAISTNTLWIYATNYAR